MLCCTRYHSDRSAHGASAFYTMHGGGGAKDVLDEDDAEYRRDSAAVECPTGCAGQAQVRLHPAEDAWELA